jgi:hypothetical protein
MSDVPAFNPHKEEDEGYRAAEAGRRLLDNPYPRGTIRFEEWRRGWHIQRDNKQKEEAEGHVAAESGLKQSANPYPKGTIRYEHWRQGWQKKNEETQRAIRLGRL